MAKSVAKHTLLSFKEAGEQTCLLQHKGHMLHSVSPGWEHGRAGTRIWSQRFHHLKFVGSLLMKKEEKKFQRNRKAENWNRLFWLSPPAIIFVVWGFFFQSNEVSPNGDFLWAVRLSVRQAHTFSAPLWRRSLKRP